jgi:hypothetical protein
MKPPVEHKQNCAAIRTRRPWECDCLAPTEPVPQRIQEALQRRSYEAGYAQAGLDANYPAAAALSIALALILIALW